jgi:hypothetical protein
MDGPRSGSVHLRFPTIVFERLKQEAVTEEMPLTHYVYQLVVKRPERIVRSKKDKAHIEALEKEVGRLKAAPSGKATGPPQTDEIKRLREQIKKMTEERSQLMSLINTQLPKARIEELERWEAFGKAILVGAQHSKDIEEMLMSIPLVSSMLSSSRSP